MTTLPPGVKIDSLPGNLQRITLDTPRASAVLYNLGAHVSQWRPAGEKPVLWMSAKSNFEIGKAIRGGVPICWPWFGPKAGDSAAPMHGLVRTVPWNIATLEPDPSTDGIVVAFTLTSPDPLPASWSSKFDLKYTVRIGRELSTMLAFTHRGDKPCEIQEALHTYLTVGDARNVKVLGLSGLTYFDKADGGQRKTQDAQPIALTAETDRVYFNTASPITLEDPGLGRRIVVTKTGSQSTVLWNPWIAKAKAMPDFGDDEWPGMICIETVNALDNKVTVQPGRTHAIRSTLRVEKM